MLVEGPPLAVKSDTSSQHKQALHAPPSWEMNGFAPLQTFEDEEDERTTTAEQVAAGGDPQNIPWGRLQVSREQYRVSPLAGCTTCCHKARPTFGFLLEPP